MVKKLESLFEINQTKRAEFSKEPQKYLDSELDLHTHLHSLGAVSAFPDKIADFIEIKGLEAVIQTMDHPNFDVS